MIVAWEIHENESAEHASQMITKACIRHGIAAMERPLVLHSDNGSAMKGGTMLSTLQRLGVVSSFSRPRVSDDNPFGSLRGHYAYFGITGNAKALNSILHRVKVIWHKWLSRRSQKSRITWEKFNLLMSRFPLAPPKIHHRYSYGRRLVNQ